MANRKGGFIGQDGLNAPDEPTGVSASAGDEQASVSFTAPSDVGGSAVTGYVATSDDGIGASGSSSPITVTGLTNGSSYTFRVWAINPFGWSSPSAASDTVSPAAARGLFAGGLNSSDVKTNTIDYITIATTGNATDFGDLTAIIQWLGACSSSSRGLFGGGDRTSATNIIEYVTITSSGNATDFGDLITARLRLAGCSSATRGLFCGGSTVGNANSNVIEYVTIDSTGNATDFGDLTVARTNLAACDSPTRGVFGGGNSGVNIIDYVTIATTGNATDFGDLIVGRYSLTACSSETRGLFMGGSDNTFTIVNVLEYVTIASTGNATDFGDLATPTGQNPGGTSSQTRGILGGGRTNVGVTENAISYVTIASTGNATDFGDLTVARYRTSACSNAHGGLS